MNKICNCGELVFTSFKEELTKEINETSAVRIIDKGKDIYKVINSTPRSEKKFLMVGKIQSGKTLNFISVMASAIREGVKLFVVMTGLDNELDNQTLTRIKNALRYEENSNFLKFYSSKDICKNETKIPEIIRNIETDKISIITTLKTNLKKVSEKFISNKFLKAQTMLIIDDEGDLASLTHSDNGDSKTYERIRELFENSNSAYLSVTATPQAHIMSGITKILRPSRVFCIDPGEGYQGIEIFTENKKYYNVINEIDNASDFITLRVFEDSILYYLLAATNLLIIGDFNERSHSNMLVHTDAETDSHKKYKSRIEELVQHVSDCVNQNTKSIEFTDMIRRMNHIIESNSLDINVDENFLNYFKYSLKNLVVSQINQTEKPEINNNFCNIFVGSQLVGRGLTLDNLLVTFFTNRANDKMAVDTLLQRARWFGYRKSILKYMKVFTTAQIVDDFENIARLDNKTWLTLKLAEANNTPFKLVESEVNTYSEKLIPTNKVPVVRQSMGKSYLNKSINSNTSFELPGSRLLQGLLKSDKYFVASDNRESKYSFKSLTFNNFDDLNKIMDISSLANLLEINKSVFLRTKKIADDKNLKIIVALLDSKENSATGTPRIRNCEKNGDDYFVDNIFQGANMDTKDEVNKYVGDIYWHKIKSHENDIFLQVHLIDPQYKKKNVMDVNRAHIFSLLFPDILLEKSEKNIFSSKEE